MRLARRRDFYIRQLRDMKVSMAVEMMGAADLAYYAEVCGWALRSRMRAQGTQR